MSTIARNTARVKCESIIEQIVSQSATMRSELAHRLGYAVELLRAAALGDDDRALRQRIRSFVLEQDAMMDAEAARPIHGAVAGIDGQDTVVVVGYRSGSISARCRSIRERAEPDTASGHARREP